MSLILNDRVRETTAVTGTGSATLLGAVTGYQSFSVIGNGNTTYYTIADQGGPNWEVGLGTYSSGTLARTTVLSSSNSGSLVNFTAGTKDVFVTQPSEKAVYLDGSGNITPSSVGPLTVSSLTDSGLTSGRVTYAGTAGLLQDSANLTFNGSTLTTLNAAYTGTLTGGTGVVNLGSGQFYKDASGNVGIGTTTINTKFQLQVGDVMPSASGNMATGAVIQTGSGAQALNLGTSSTNSYAWINSAYANSSNTAIPMLFMTGATERMRIDSSGNVGIGTTAPSYPLDAIGIIRSNSTASISGGLIIPNAFANPALQVITNQTNSAATSIINNWGNSSNPGVLLGTTQGNGIALQVGSSIPLSSGLPSSGGTTVFTVNASGAVQKPNNPAFGATSTTGGFPTQALGTYFTFNNVPTTFANTVQSAGFNTSNNYYTAPVAGVYQFYCQLYCVNTNSSVTWWKNGVEVNFNSTAITFLSTAGGYIFNGSIILSLAAGDYVGLQPRSGTSSVQWYPGHSFFFGYLIG